MASLVSSAFRDRLTTSLRSYAGIADTDPRISRPAIVIGDEGSSKTTSTVRVTDSAVTITVDDGMPDSLAFASNPTLTAMVAAIDALGGGINATLVAADGAAASSALAPIPETSILGTTVQLVAEDLAIVSAAALSAFRAVERACYTNLVDGGQVIEQAWPTPGGKIVLANGRINRLDSVCVDAEVAFDVRYDGAADRATIEIQSMAGAITDNLAAVPVVILRAQTFGDSTDETTIDVDADVSVVDVVAAINAVSGFASTIRRDGSAIDLAPMPTRLVSPRRSQSVYGWVPADGEYRVDAAAGILHLDGLAPFVTGSDVTAGQIRLRYRCGFRDPDGTAAMPADLDHAIAVVGKSILDSATRDASLASERLGDYAYTVSPGSGGAVQASIMSMAHVIRPYVRAIP